MTAIEFGLLGTIYLMLTFILLDTGFYFFQQAILDYSTRIASRALLTGVSGNPPVALTYSAFGTALCNNVFNMIPCSQLSFSVQSSVSNSFSATQTSPGFVNITPAVPSSTTGFKCTMTNAGVTTCTSGGFSAGSPTDAVLVQVGFNRQYLFGSGVGKWLQAINNGSAPIMVSNLPLQVEAY